MHHSTGLQFGGFIETAAHVVIFQSLRVYAGDEEPGMAKRAERKNNFCFVCLTRDEPRLGKELKEQTSIAQGSRGFL